MNCLLAMAIGFAISLVLTAVLIPILRHLKFRQEIREIGPQWHKGKSGTPTMGGLGFIFAIVAAIIATGSGEWALVGGAVAFGAIGFIDDFIKVALKRNLGLRAWQKFSLQLLAAIVIMVILVDGGHVETLISIPFSQGGVFDLGAAYIPIMAFIILGCVNAVNLTDGLDGLVSSVTMIIGLFFMIISAAAMNEGLSVSSAAMVGGILGFFVFNVHPARVFMGDTGSLFLGGMVALTAIMMGNPLILLVVGIIYILETLSVIIQVVGFKLTGRRIFKMSPIHHHFEQLGWKEGRIVWTFSAVTFAACLLALWRL
ncbi:MAG: phospho-N-acetylmuramoyl-pentapeptide-transferase [Clostridiales bacterium]|jgi:phospho-N-acetylmuramoyl-pentapeptide-transferase|nr:phospho-N-acetylmuramoyl-pentapeptide-transferase [Clostridiales bacterium]